MNKQLVMTAIYHELELLFRIYNNKENQKKPKVIEGVRKDIADLYEAYFELRGSKATICNILGVDNEPNSVDSIYQLTRGDDC